MSIHRRPATPPERSLASGIAQLVGLWLLSILILGTLITALILFAVWHPIVVTAAVFGSIACIVVILVGKARE